MKTKPSLTTKTTSILNLSYYPNWNLRKMNPSCYLKKMTKMQKMNCCSNPNYRWNSIETSLKRMKTQSLKTTPNWTTNSNQTKNCWNQSYCSKRQNRNLKTNSNQNCYLTKTTESCCSKTVSYCSKNQNCYCLTRTMRMSQNLTKKNRMTIRTNSKTRCLTNC